MTSGENFEFARAPILVNNYFLIIFQDLQNRPRLAAILVGNNPASKVYLTHKEAACKEVGIDSEIYALNENCDTSDAEGLINHLNEREDVHGILLQLPLPPQLDERSIC